MKKRLKKKKAKKVAALVEIYVESIFANFQSAEKAFEEAEKSVVDIFTRAEERRAQKV